MSDYYIAESTQMFQDVLGQLQNTTGTPTVPISPLTNDKLLYSNAGKIYSGSVSATWLNGIYSGTINSDAYIYDLSIKNKIQGYDGGDLVFGNNTIIIDDTANEVYISPTDYLYITSDLIDIGLIGGTKDININGILSHKGAGLGFYNTTAVVQASAITDADGTLGGNQTAINAILAALRNIGIIAST